MNERSEHSSTTILNQSHSSILRYGVILNIITLLTIIAGTVFSYQHVFPFYDPQGVYPFLPGDILIDLIWLYVICLIVGAIVYFATPTMAILFLKLHRVFKGGYRYHLQEKETSQEGSTIRRLVVPSLTSLGIAVSLAGSSIATSLFVYANFDNLESPQPAIEATFPIFFILLLVASVILLLFVPIWLLGDVGVICEKEYPDVRSTVNIEGVGDYYLKLLKGFAGVSTVITYGLLIIQMFDWYGSLMNFEDIPFPIAILFIPVIIAMLGPVIVMGPLSLVQGLYEVSLTKNSGKLEEVLQEQGFERIKVEIVPVTQSDTSEP